MSPLKRTVTEFLIGLPVVVGVYALLEWMYSAIISKSPFVFDVKTCSMCVMSWLVISIILYIARRKKQEK
ncbi:MAG: hypothetical protein IJI48_01310 [Ruminococcus sp.]|nr:hypothetical protein [Ruminococcus sp.]MBQ9472012.1 hypothetical protein [Ruminococcus sp.]